MKTILAFILATTFFIQSYGQITLTGKIVSIENNVPVSGAIVISNHSTQKNTTDNEGNFKIKGLHQGLNSLFVQSISFQSATLTMNISNDTSLIIALHPALYMMDEVLVVATKSYATIAAKTDLNKKDIAALNLGQDVPYLLNRLPSIVTTSDAGNGIGYSGIRIRGIDPSRINVSINGIPVNDAESHNMYWVDLPDIATSAENIQVQRGVGTSTNGAGAFGGTINLQTNTISTEPYFETNASFGSFNTLKNNVSLGSGLLHKHWTFEGRLSKISSDGYIDRAKSDLKSFYVSGGYYGKNTIIKTNIFSGKEITYQSWYGVPESRLKNDINGMNIYISNNGLNEVQAYNLLNSNRTYNYYEYENQVDNYRQDYYQFFVSHQLNEKTLLNTALHYTKGIGYYEEYKYDEALAAYNIESIVINTDTITSSDIVRRKWLDNNFYGFTYSLKYGFNARNNVILGGAWNQYDGDHFGELVWLQWASSSKPGQHYYKDNALKTDFNIFAKYDLNIFDRFTLYIDQQYRRVSYLFTGFDENFNVMPQKDILHFYNPKGALQIKFGETHKIYFSAGVANKEPNRDDYISSTEKSRPKKETLTDFETGYHFNSTKISATVNLYYMDYNNQLVLTGAVNDVGNYTRTNIKDSYRKGLEVEASYSPLRKFQLAGNITLSRTGIATFTEYLDDYANGGQQQFIYNNTNIAFSPDFISSVSMRYVPFKNFKIQLVSKHVGKQYLDNTQAETRIIDSYSVYDLQLEYSIKNILLQEISFRLMLNNILNHEYVSNGYTYGYIYGSEIRENMYFPQAGFNTLGQLTLRF